MDDLEDYRAGSLITSIDYAKAFNRLSFQECLKAFASKGASTELLALVATFLINRTMLVRVGESWSAPRPVHGGVPQGSILGVMLFNVTTETLEERLDLDTLSGEALEPPTSEEEQTEDDRPNTRSGLRASSPTGGDSSHRPPSPPLSPVLQPGYQYTAGPRSADQYRVDDIPIPHEPNPRTSAKWKPSIPLSLKYVDDGMTIDNINFENATTTGSTRTKHAAASQNISGPSYIGPSPWA